MTITLEVPSPVGPEQPLPEPGGPETPDNLPPDGPLTPDPKGPEIPEEPEEGSDEAARFAGHGLVVLR